MIHFELGTTSADAAEDVPHGGRAHDAPIARIRRARTRASVEVLGHVGGLSRESDLMGTGRDVPTGNAPGGAPLRSAAETRFSAPREVCGAMRDCSVDSQLRPRAVMAAGDASRKGALPQAVQRGKPKMGRDGDHGAGLRIGFGRRYHLCGARWRLLG